MDDPVMPEPLIQPRPEPETKLAVQKITDTQPDGTPVVIEVHHNPAEL